MHANAITRQGTHYLLIKKKKDFGAIYGNNIVLHTDIINFPTKKNLF